jgi:hypothetical protein
MGIATGSLREHRGDFPMMRTTWISTVSVLALLAAPAVAQTTDGGVPRNSGSPAPIAAPKQA